MLQDTDFPKVGEQKHTFRLIGYLDFLIDKVYLDGSWGSKTVAGILLVRLNRVTHFYKDAIPVCDPLSVRLGP